MKIAHHFAITLILILLPLITIAADTAAPTPPATVSFTGVGNFEPVACIASCGACCGSIGTITETNGGFQASVGSSSILPDTISDADAHQFTGHFYSSTGSCNQGSCTYFNITDVDNLAPHEASARYNSSTQTLNIKNLDVDEKSRFQVELEGPFTVKNFTALDTGTYAGQHESCVEGGSICQRPQSCIKYYGIAGASGPLFASCETTCRSNSDCSNGQICGTVADGPGQVCMTQ